MPPVDTKAVEICSLEWKITIFWSGFCVWWLPGELCVCALWSTSDKISVIEALQVKPWPLWPQTHLSMHIFKLSMHSEVTNVDHVEQTLQRSVDCWWGDWRQAFHWRFKKKVISYYYYYHYIVLITLLTTKQNKTNNKNICKGFKSFMNSHTELEIVIFKFDCAANESLLKVRRRCATKKSVFCFYFLTNVCSSIYFCIQFTLLLLCECNCCSIPLYYFEFFVGFFGCYDFWHLFLLLFL